MVSEKLNESFFQYYLGYTNKYLLPRPIEKGPITDIFLQLSNSFLNTRGTVNVLRNMKLDRQLQKLIIQNFAKIIIQFIDNIWE